MSDQRQVSPQSPPEKSNKANGFFGSLKDVLRAAGRDEPVSNAAAQQTILMPPPLIEAQASRLSAEEAAKLARGACVSLAVDAEIEPERVPLKMNADAPPTTRVLRRDAVAKPNPNDSRTVVVRGKQQIQRNTFSCDPVVAFLVVVGGPGLGSYRAVYEGNNTIGRSGDNRIAFDFGDETISSDAQAYLRYDASDRTFIFVPNLAKTNVVSVNDKKPTAAVELKAMDVITLGRTQVAFVPFCGADFDWSEISDT